MVVKKSLILVLFVLILPISFAASNLTLALSTDQVAENQPFDGTLSLILDKQTPSDFAISFYVNDKQVYNTTLKQAIEGLPSVSIAKESYKSKNTISTSVNYNFEKAGKLVLAALKFDANADAIKYTVPLSFNIKGSQSGTYPKNVRIDINNDGITDYSYKGKLIDEFETLDQSQLNSKTQPEAYASMKGQAGSIYCTKTIVKPSSSFKIFALIRPSVDWGASIPIQATISDAPLSSASCGPNDDECCTLKASTSGWASCQLKKEIDLETNAYICLFIIDENSFITSLYYDLGYYKDATVKKSYIKGIQTEKNFFLYAQRQLFETVLSSTALLEKDATQLKSIIGKTASDLVPIAVYSDTPGIVTLSNLSFQYDTDVPNAMDSFTNLDFTKESVSYDGELKIPLSQFSNLTAGSVSEDNEIYVSFNNEDSNKESFSVIPGPSVWIQTTTDNAYLGQVLEFAAQSNANITSYSWDFGDNSTGTGQSLKHFYSKEGTYSVILTAKDENNVTSKASISVKVASLKDSMSFLIEDTKSRLDNLKLLLDNSSVDYKEILGYLGANNQVTDLNANLTLINNSFLSALSDTKLNASALDTKLQALKQQIDDARSKLITDISFSSIEFTPRASDVSQMPSAVSLGMADEQNFAEKLLKYQETASVSGIVYTVQVDYILSQSIITIVKKSATGSGTYYEVIPAGLSPKPLSTQSYKAVIPNSVYQFSSSFVYSLEGDLKDSALQSATIIVPADLSSIQIGNSQAAQTKEVCGDGICAINSENSNNCPQDCTASKPWWIIIVLVLVLAAGLFAIYYFKDKLFVPRSNPMQSKIFNNEKDYRAVKSYIESSLKKGFTDMQIGLALKKQGWKQNQIDYAMQEVKKLKKK